MTRVRSRQIGLVVAWYGVKRLLKLLGVLPTSGICLVSGTLETVYDFG